MGMQENMAEMMRAIKQNRRMSMGILSDELGIAPSTLQNYMNGTGNPTIKMVEHIAHKLEVDPLTLVSGKMDQEQYQIVLLLLSTIQSVADLPQPRRLKFAELFLELVQLWEEDA